MKLELMTLLYVNQDYVDWLNNPLVNKYLGSRDIRWDLSSLIIYVQKQLENPCVFFKVIIIDGIHIGNIKLTINHNENHGDIGIIIGRKEYWGKGYGTEAIKQLTAFAFKELYVHKTFAGICVENKASICAFKNAGYHKEAILREHILISGKYKDCHIYTKVA